jgi:3-oxoacyl-(acyl-carrier-protein) synthase
VNPNRFPNTVINSAGGYVSIWEDLRAPNVTVVDGNCGALDAVLTSETHLSNGRADAFIVGGGEVLSAPLYLAFRKLDALADRGRIYAPGQASGQGMRLGEAAAYLAIERQPDAERRGARVYGRILGYGNTFEPPESEAQLVHASERAIERAVRMAIADAGVSPAAIDLVCASAGGMAPFDRAELAALERVLGPDVAVATPKALYGETYGAGGALGTVCALSWLDGAAVGPIVRGALPGKPRCVLVVAVGFYGNASALIVSG